MARSLRYIPRPDLLVLVTTRVVRGLFLLKPCPQLNPILVGVLGRAQRLTGMKVCFYSVQSNHIHLLLRPADAHQLSRFMAHVNSNIAREVSRHYGWGEKFWGRRYSLSVVSDEPEAQIERLRYCLSQGCKDGLIASPRHWPGPTATHALLEGKSIEVGQWIDRTGRSRSRVVKTLQAQGTSTTNETLELTPIPCWDHLSTHQRSTRARCLVRQIELETELRPGQPLGKQAVLAQNPFATPQNFARRPAPRFHAWRAEVRQAFEAAYRIFLADFRQAAMERKNLFPRPVPYPPGCFPGAGRFVPLEAPP